MSDNEITLLVEKWKAITHSVLSLEDLSMQYVQELLKETYRILTAFHKEKLIPKEICELFLEMKDFLYLTSLMEEKEKGVDYYHWQEISCIVTALEKGFFNGEYECDFPRIKVDNLLKESFIIDLEFFSFEDNH